MACSSPSSGAKSGAKKDGIGGVNEKSPLLGASWLIGNLLAVTNVETHWSRRKWLRSAITVYFLSD